MLEGILQSHLVAVAVREFEAWFVADHRAQAAVCGVDVDAVDAPEGLPAREAKDLLRARLSGHDDEREARIEIARRLDLDLVATRSPSFRAFRDDLGRALTSLGH